ncbi:MAG: hypothetical protein EA387_12490 [Nitriliruptor sp.]|nr:MAG: hypothetical protein EA387_12490 [Nitriliruptor sp.]
MGAMSGTAFASPPELPPPPTHEHSLITPGNGNMVKIGPPVCRVEQAARGASNFHKHVHRGVPWAEAGLDIGFYPDPDLPPGTPVNDEGQPIGPPPVDELGRWCAS